MRWNMLWLLTVIVATGAGNLLVCAAVCRERSLQNMANYFLMSLATADLLFFVTDRERVSDTLVGGATRKNTRLAFLLVYRPTHQPLSTPIELRLKDAESAWFMQESTRIRATSQCDTTNALSRLLPQQFAATRTGRGYVYFKTFVTHTMSRTRPESNTVFTKDIT